MSPITFEVLGEPKSQPRPKAARIGGFIRIYTPKTAAKWKGAVAKAAAPFLASGPLTGPLQVVLIFSFARPKSHLRTNGELSRSAPAFHVKKPDVDNLAKAVMDALTDAGLWHDDDQVVHLSVIKRYRQAEPEGCLVVVNQCPDTTSPAQSVGPATPSPSMTTEAPTVSPAATTPAPAPCPKKKTSKKPQSPRSDSPSLTGKSSPSTSGRSRRAPAKSGATP